MTEPPDHSEDIEPRPAERPRLAIGLGAVLLAVSVTLLVGLAQKAPCATGSWGDGRQYRMLCYSDVVALYGARGLSEDKFPYVEASNEYPVGTGLLMAAAAVPASTYGQFFFVTALLLSLCAVTTAVALYRLAGGRALMFAAAPTLAVYAFVNWDLLAVMLATLATYAFIRRRDGGAGILLGLGAAAKLYPVFLVIPFMAQRLSEDDREAAVTVAWSAVATWIGVNLPFAIAAPSNWAEFFRLNSTRVADWDSLWYSGCQRGLGSLPVCDSIPLLNAVSLVLFVGLVALVWWRKARSEPGFPAWTLGFPIVALFLLTNKVYSPQYSLWVLPWFALALPSVRLWVAFELADVAVFVTRFAWFGRNELGRNPDFNAGWTEHFAIGYFEVMVLIRALVLITCIVAWVRRRHRDDLVGELDVLPPPALPPRTVGSPA